MSLNVGWRRTGTEEEFSGQQVATAGRGVGRRRSRERLAGNSRRRRNTRSQGGSLEGLGVYVGREPGRLVISSGGVISWMQLPSRRPNPFGNSAREGETKWRREARGKRHRVVGEGEGRCSKVHAIFHPWRDGYRVHLAITRQVKQYRAI